MQINKLSLAIITTLLLIGFVSADLGTYEQDSCVNIKTILNSTWVNISSLSYPNSSIALTQKSMSKNGVTFNYSFCNTNELGVYIYDYYDNTGEVYVNTFTITREGVENENGVYVTIWLAGFVLLYLGFIYRRVVPLYKLTGHILIFLNGLLGIFIFDNPLTLLVMGSSLIFMFKGFMEFSKNIFE
jgi:hypothetical protein